MVTVVDYKERYPENGDSFFVLVLEGGIMPVKSSSTESIYFTSKTATVPATFNEETCKSLIGQEFPGTIEKEKCDPYEYVTEDDEVIEMNHRYVYVDESLVVLEEQIISENEVI